MNDSNKKYNTFKNNDNNFSKDNNSSSNIIYINPHQKRISEIRKTIDALLDIRLSLSTSKLLSDKMSVREFKEIIERQKEKEKDIKVSEEIDNLFKDIIPINKDAAVSMVDKEIDKQKHILEELQKEGENKYTKESGNEKGVSRVLRDKNHKTSSDSSLQDVG